ncbi:MAG: hypothetical protein AAF721_38405 [Myxococcota bacterium]
MPARLLSRVPTPVRLIASALASLTLACTWQWSAGTKPPAAGSTGKPIPPPAESPAKPVAASDEPDAPGDGGSGNATSVTASGPLEEAVDTPSTVHPVRAVCVMDDAVLDRGCHTAFDPFAQDDEDLLFSFLASDATLTAPGADGSPVVAHDADAFREAVSDAGGLRGFANIEAKDRVVGSVLKDCRRCDPSTVTFAANTRSGAIEVQLRTRETTEVIRVELSAASRPRLRMRAQ